SVQVIESEDKKSRRRRAASARRKLKEAPANMPALADGADKVIIRKKQQPKSPPPTTAPVESRREGYEFIEENDFHDVARNPLSTFSIDVDAASYANMRRFLRNGQLPPADAVRIEEMVNYFHYEYPAPTDDTPFSVSTEVGICPWNTGHRLVHIGVQGKKMVSEDMPPANLVFLIDVSGSMSAPNKLPLLKTSFKMLVDQLRPQDKVAIVVYAGAAGVVLKPTSGQEKATIKNALDQLKAGGSTAGGAGIQLAYQLARENFAEGGNNRVILATDGDFNVGLSNDSELVRLIESERESGIFLTVLGFGTGNYQDTKMQKLADHGNGNHAYIDHLNEARKVLVEEFGGTLFTIAKDVKIQVEFNPARVAAYRLIGYENRLLDEEDFNDDTKDAGELGAGHSVTALYEIVPAGTDDPAIRKADALKYQKTVVPPEATDSDEWLTVKLRYKKPEGGRSRALEFPVSGPALSAQMTSDNFRWSAAVAGFGMLLRQSKFIEKWTFADVRDLAQSAIGPDLNGYRAEFVELIERAQALTQKEVAGR
ncbi:MAG: VWA domain-containing protein, partial [Bacteroidetes bacterium]